MDKSQFGGVGYHHADQIESGWQTLETFLRWVTWSRPLYDDGGLF
jgi:hypothetical protein